MASVSFGKDSLATVILAIRNNELLDEALYCEAMFDNEISGEIPEHRAFIYDTALPKLQSWGINTVILRSKDNYVSNFKRIITRGTGKGKIRSFPLCGKCSIQRDCKVPPINAYKASLSGDVVQYIGYAYDEQERLMRLDNKNEYLCFKNTKLANTMHLKSAVVRVYFLQCTSLPIAAVASFAPVQSGKSCGTFMTVTRTQ